MPIVSQVIEVRTFDPHRVMFFDLARLVRSGESTDSQHSHRLKILTAGEIEDLFGYHSEDRQLQFDLSAGEQSRRSLGTDAILPPMHILGFGGHQRRYADLSSLRVARDSPRGAAQYFPAGNPLPSSTEVHPRYLALDTPVWVKRRAKLLPIAKVWIGPGNHAAFTKISVQLLLEQTRSIASK
jgi:hypothetical protein